MKNVQELSNRKVPIVAIDPALNKYEDKIMFPKKLELGEQYVENS